MSDQDPLEPLKILGQQLEKVLTEMGLELQNFAILPNFGDGPHMAQAVISFDGAAVSALMGTASDQKVVDDEFAEIMRAQRKEEAAEKEKAAMEGLEKLRQQLEGDTGILPEE